MGKGISIDRTKRLREEPRTGHNRWHPDIAPVIEVDPSRDRAVGTVVPPDPPQPARS